VKREARRNEVIARIAMLIDYPKARTRYEFGVKVSIAVTNARAA
jgi:hypothetical protein